MALKTDDLYLRLARGSQQGLLRDQTGGQDATPPVWVAGDQFTLRLHLCEAIGSELDGFNGVALPAGDALVLAGRPATGLGGEAEGELLFNAIFTSADQMITGCALATITVMTGGSGYTSTPTVTFTGGTGTGASAVAVLQDGALIGITLVTAGSGYLTAPTIGFTGGAGSGATATAQLAGVPQYHYEQTLDLTPDELSDALAVAIGAGGKSLTVACDVEHQTALNAARKTYRFEAAILPQVYQGTEVAPAPGAPVYPLPADIPARLVAGQYRLTAGGLYLWNATQSKWHRLYMAGAAGAEYIAWDAGVT